MKNTKAKREALKASGVKPFDAADYLDRDEAVAEYLTAALEEADPDLFLTAIKDVARARGMTQLARDTGLGRESLYKALSAGAKPRYDTVCGCRRLRRRQMFQSRQWLMTLPSCAVRGPWLGTVTIPCCQRHRGYFCST